MEITTGNAATDGSVFNGWFIGAVQKWADERSIETDFGLRQSAIVELKWGIHHAGETRPEWAACSARRTMSLLVRGQFLLRFRSPGDRSRVIERRLVRAGDYAIWGTDLEHTWVLEEDSVIFTVRWREQP